MKTKITKKITSLLILTGGLAVATSALAAGGGGGSSDPNLEGFTERFNQASGSGQCSVQRVYVGSHTHYVPSGGPGRYHLLAWGNGTGGTSTTYSGLLNRLASHCIFVAAANTANSGSGDDIIDAVNDARSRYANKLQSNLRICTSGHSQGGGGSFNAAGRLGANCVIAVQPDTRFTVRIVRTLPANAAVVALWGDDDTLAPRIGNERNVEDAARSALASVETNNEGHFAPTSGSGGRVGTLQRVAAKAYLDVDSGTRDYFRAVFEENSGATATTASSDITYAEIR